VLCGVAWQVAASERGGAPVGPRAVFLAYGISLKYNGLRRGFAPHNENVTRRYSYKPRRLMLGGLSFCGSKAAHAPSAE